MRRRSISLLFVSLLAVLLAPTAARAASSQFTMVEARSELVTSPPDQALDEIVSLGAEAIRLQLGWDGVTPGADARTKPAGFVATSPDSYNWSEFDRAIEEPASAG